MHLIPIYDHDPGLPSFIMTTVISPEPEIVHLPCQTIPGKMPSGLCGNLPYLLAAIIFSKETQVHPDTSDWEL